MLKENNNRKKRFQLKTVVDKKNRIIYKESIDESDIFLDSFIKKYEKLDKNESKKLIFNKIWKRRKNKLFFDFIDWETLEEKIDKNLSEKYILYYFDVYIDIIDLFKVCEAQNVYESKKVFWKSIDFLSKNEMYLKSGLLDLIFGNIIINENINVIDYEWVFDFPVNKKYAIWRSFYYYLCKIEKEKNIDVKKIYKFYKQKIWIWIIQEWLFINMEYNFQKYVNSKKPNRLIYLKTFYMTTMFKFSRLYNK